MEMVPEEPESIGKYPDRYSLPTKRRFFGFLENKSSKAKGQNITRDFNLYAKKIDEKKTPRTCRIS